MDTLYYPNIWWKIIEENDVVLEDFYVSKSPKKEENLKKLPFADALTNDDGRDGLRKIVGRSCP